MPLPLLDIPANFPALAGYVPTFAATLAIIEKIYSKWQDGRDSERHDKVTVILLERISERDKLIERLELENSELRRKT